MRVLNVINTIDPASGGPLEWVRQFGTTAINMGHEVEIVTMDPPDRAWPTPFPFPVHQVGGIAGALYSSQLVPWLKASAKNYDCVVAHGLWRYSSFGTWRALRKSKTPYFLYTHGMMGPWFAKHHPIKDFMKRLYWPWTEYPALRDAAGVIFTCEQERRYAHRAFLPYKCNELVSMLGIARPEGDAEEQCRMFKEKFPTTANHDLLIFLGRIHPTKGCDILIKAFSEIAKSNPTIHLVMAGPDYSGWVDRYKAQAEMLGVSDRITWTGMVSGDLKWGALRSASAFILPSHHENFGISAVEALACGIPVLITDAVNIWREINTYDAALIMQDNTESIVKTLLQWTQLDDERKSKMAANATRCYLDLFEVTNATSGLCSLLEQHIRTGKRA